MITWPFTVAGEIILGVGQTPKEIWDILNAGRTNIHILRSRIGAIQLETERHENKIYRLEKQLEACLAANRAGNAQPVTIRGRT